MFVWGFWGRTLPCFERGTSGGGKRLQYRDTTRAREPCAEFLPSDKSSRRVTAKWEGQGRDEREQRAVNSILPERNGALGETWASVKWPSGFSRASQSLRVMFLKLYNQLIVNTCRDLSMFLNLSIFCLR